ncbi:glycosyl hydrolases 15 family protein [Paraburkholderia xenovorans LB400]|uniref:Glycoside hydrolase, family 15 n=1 Tax=Paraburkholderia xenovorans (strain LB400) TaxID=266265 RepID=Q13YR6_PARXL|nr:glycoside hydrolase family 15 protein [Paraburkholderia xenovorans]ABE30773.1 Putative glycoside hydrolase, family 15 [Paraburkholderia xenovorans LB400]AIP30984.1 glycosyl hydrolases 15 family protein [Paraburkholderia xenovorans LB400]
MPDHRPIPPRPALATDARGLIGNMKTTALVSLRGSIDFMCFPRIDSPAIFAGLLEPSRGGAFSIAPTCEAANVKQMYLPDTNVLLTRFMTPEGVCELMDFMPVPRDDGKLSADAPLPNCVIRVARMVHGRMAFTMRCEPRFDYADGTHTAHILEDGAVEFHAETNADSGSGMQLRLNSTLPLALDGNAAHAGFELQHGESAGFAFGDAAGLRDKSFDCEAALADTMQYWRSWSAQSTYRGRYREVVMRSALTLKLLSSSEHGAIVAAPTFGLPEALDGSRRWDYRFTWIRDAAFSVYALLRLGYTGEARHFMKWIAERSRHCDSDGSLNVMYTVDGRKPPAETEVASLANGDGDGAAGAPLVGNAAREQIQLDVYGALLDAIYLYNKYGAAISHEGWRDVTRTVDYVVEHWREPDHGIWEFRNGLRPLLHSRLMCWVTVDRALRLAEKRSLPAPLKRWFDTRDAIRADIHEHFWNDELGAFVQTPDSKRLDASALMMPLVRFIGPTDPRWLGTLDAIGGELKVDPLIFRYTRGSTLDGLPGIEGGFSACSFWYAEALARAGRVDEGRLVFEKMLAYANHVGLFSEEVATSGEALGNFPQALTHLALISAAYQLDRNLDKVHIPWT